MITQIIFTRQRFSEFTKMAVAFALQTGSGKSHTMMGSGGALDQDVFPEYYGLVPRICSGLFDKMEQQVPSVLSRTNYLCLAISI